MVVGVFRVGHLAHNRIRDVRRAEPDLTTPEGLTSHDHNRYLHTTGDIEVVWSSSERHVREVSVILVKAFA